MSMTVTMDLASWDAVQHAKREAEQIAADLRKELATAKMSDADGRVQALTEMVRASLEIVRFAVGNIHAGSGLHWPAEALDKIATLMPSLPDYQVDDNELSIEFKSFAREAARLNARRLNQ
jgi:4-hydroxy-3-methylbut-2-en-1-yl diphosphate synthase IspG/GcpE